jgi:hypothetical protein
MFPLCHFRVLHGGNRRVFEQSIDTQGIHYIPLCFPLCCYQ